QSAVGLDPSGSITANIADDIYFSFTIPSTTIPGITNSISFTLGDAGGDNEVFIVHSFSLANIEINTQNVAGASRFPVVINTPGVNRVRIEFLSDPFGYSMDDLNFNPPVPEPTSLAAAGIAIVAMLRRRRR